MGQTRRTLVVERHAALPYGGGAPRFAARDHIDNNVVTMERTVGVRDLKARLSHYLDVVREGGAVIITDRGRPIARITAIGEAARAATIDDVLDALEAEGALERAAQPARK